MPIEVPVPVPLTSNSHDRFMISQVEGMVPPGFDILGYARSVRQRLHEAYTVRQVHDGLRSLGLGKNAATQFEGAAIVIYCPEFEPLLPDDSNDWW